MLEPLRHDAAVTLGAGIGRHALTGRRVAQVLRTWGTDDAGRAEVGVRRLNPSPPGRGAGVSAAVGITPPWCIGVPPRDA